MSPALQLRGSVRLHQFSTDYDLQISEGEPLAVTGANGVGKTTLLRVIAGLEPLATGTLVVDGVVWDEPDSGTFLAPHKRRVGYLPASGVLLSHLDVLTNVAYPLRRAGVDKAAALERGRKALQQVQLRTHEARSTSQLSSGERQRVGIARVLAASPRVVLLDEPLAHLDADSRPPFRALLGEVFRDSRYVSCVITHAEAETNSLADHRVELRRSR